MAHPSTQTAPSSRRVAHEAVEPTLPADCVELFAQALHIDGAKPGEDGKLPLPKWVHLSPAGDEGHELAKKGERVVRGRDGREFAVGDVKRVIKGTELPMQFDWDHESVSWFGSTKAAGWIDEIVYLEKGDDERPAPGFWGHVERWTPEGKSDVEDAYFRGLSPVVRYEYRQPAASDEPSPPPLLVGFVNVALTNRPNLKMTMLNREGGSGQSNHATGTPPAQEKTMEEELIELARELGLSGEVDHKQLARAVRERFSTLQSHARDLEKRIAETAHAAFCSELDAAFEHASESGKITPADLKLHRRLVKTPDDLAEFKAHVAALPKHAVTKPVAEDPPKAETGTYSREEREFFTKMGFSEQEWAESQGVSRG